VLSGKAIERINASPIKQIIATDSIQLKTETPKLAIESVAFLFAEAIRRNFNNESISSLFDVDKG